MSDSVTVDNVGVEVSASDQSSRSEEEGVEPTEFDRSVNTHTVNTQLSILSSQITNMYNTSSLTNIPFSRLNRGTGKSPAHIGTSAEFLDVIRFISP